MEEILKEIKNYCSEINPLPDEKNTINITNDKFTEINIAERREKDKQNKKKSQMRLLLSFIVLCAAVVIVNTGFYLPIFSEIFSPQPPNNEFVYITDLKTKTSYDKDYKYILIQITANNKFTNFNSIYFELYNITLDSLVTDYSIINKADLKTSWASIPKPIASPEYNYQLRLYCSTSNPEKIEYTNSFVKDEITYYLFYVYDKIITY